MRNAFAQIVTKLAHKNKKIVLLSGDIGNRLFDKYKKKHKKRFINCGVAEALMTGIASGLASSGSIPITYTITTFNTLRCLEQIKLDVAYQKLPVIIVGTGAGLSYSALGATHHSLDDYSILKCIPNLNIYAPADSIELESVLNKAVKDKLPTYIRIGKKGEKNFSKKKSIKANKVNVIKKGSKYLILCAGTTISVGNDLINLIKNKKDVELTSICSIKPFDKNYFIKQFKIKKKIILIEEQMSNFGFGNSLKNFLYEKKIFNKNFYVFGTPEKFLKGLGNQNEARESLGLNAKSIYNKVFKNK